MRLLFAVLTKELLDAIRDVRSVLSAAIFPLVGPLIISLTLGQLVRTASEVQTLEVPVVGAEHAPQLVNYLEGKGVTVTEGPDDAHAAIRNGTADLVLVIPTTFPEEFRAGDPAGLELVMDRSKQATASSIRHVRSLIGAYSSQIASLRLIARGVGPELMVPIRTNEVDLATPETRAAGMLDMIVMFLVMGAFIGNMYLAIDVTAGERERGSLEPLLTTPVPRTILVVGKWLAAVVFGLGGMLLTLVLIVLMLGQVPTEELGVRISLGAEIIFKALGILTPLALFAASMQLLVATFAKSFREAQTYLTLTLFIPMIPGMIMALNPMNPADWHYTVPVLSQQMQVADLLRGLPIPAMRQLLGFATTMGVSAVLLGINAALYRREGVLYR